MGCTRSPPGCEEKNCDIILNAKRDKGYLRVTLLKRAIKRPTETSYASPHHDESDQIESVQEKRAKINNGDSLNLTTSSSREVLILELTTSDRQNKIQFRCHVGENRVNR